MLFPRKGKRKVIKKEKRKDIPTKKEGATEAEIRVKNKK